MRAPVGLREFDVRVPVTVAPPLNVARPVTPIVPVKAAALDIVWPLTVPVRVLPAGVTLNLLNPLTWRSMRLPVAPALVLFTVNMAAAAWFEVRLSWPNCGVLADPMSWIVLTAPPVTEKLVVLKLAIPFDAVVASLMVIVPAAAEALATVKMPV
jgi:hypothetical protein